MCGLSIAATFVAVPALVAFVWAIPGFGGRTRDLVVFLSVLLSLAAFGVWLLRGYLDVRRGGTRPQSFWWASLAFNAVGLVAYSLPLIMAPDGAVGVVCLVGLVWVAPMAGLSARALRLATAVGTGVDD